MGLKKEDREGQYNLLNDLYNNKGTQKEVALKYHYSESHASQVMKKFRQLKYPVKLNEEGNIVCFKCGSNHILEFHHNHTSGQLIALLCRSCNLKVGHNELEYMSEEQKEIRREKGLQAVRPGFVKKSFDIDENLLFEVDKLSKGRPLSFSYDLNMIIENYFKLLSNIENGNLEAKSDIDEVTLKWLESL